MGKAFRFRNLLINLHDLLSDGFRHGKPVDDSLNFRHAAVMMPMGMMMSVFMVVMVMVVIMLMMMVMVAIIFFLSINGDGKMRADDAAFRGGGNGDMDAWKPQCVHRLQKGGFIVK